MNYDESPLSSDITLLYKYVVSGFVVVAILGMIAAIAAAPRLETVVGVAGFVIFCARCLNIHIRLQRIVIRPKGILVGWGAKREVVPYEDIESFEWIWPFAGHRFARIRLSRRCGHGDEILVALSAIPLFGREHPHALELFRRIQIARESSNDS